MKRIAFAESRFASTFASPDGVRRYVAHHARRAEKLGKAFARSLTRLGFRRGRVLDVGSASGQAAVAMARALPGAEVVGLDACEHLVEMASAYADERGLSGRVSFVQGDAQAMAFEDDSFAAIVSNDTLHVVADPVAMIDECERVLVPAGAMVLRNIRRCWLGWVDGVFRTAYTAAEVEAILKRSRLRPWRLEVGLMTLCVEAGGPAEPT